METTIEQQVAMDEALVPSAQRNILHICPRVQGQSFTELPFEEEILDFIWFFGHSATIRTLTDVNINKLYQPWRSFAAIINKCLTGKTYGYDSLRLSQAQILWGLYHKRNVDYAFLIWEDFVFQVEHKNQKKSNEMYYPRFTKVIIHHFMSKDPSIPWRNKVNWHYVRDDFMFSTIKLVSRHQNTQEFGALLLIELTNEEIRNSKAYKEYHAIATREAAPKPKASTKRTKSGSDTSITSEEELSWNSSDDEGADDQEKVDDDDEGDEGTNREEGEEDDDDEDKDDDEDEDGDERDDDDKDQEVAKNDDQDNAEGSGDDDEEGKSDEEDVDEEIKDEESFDPITQTPEDSEDEDDGEEDLGLNIGEEERHDEEEEEDELYRDVNINQGRGLQGTLRGMESIFETTSRIDVQTPTSMTPLPMTIPTMTSSTIATATTTSQAPIPPTPIPSEVLQNLPTFTLVFRFDDRLRSLEQNFSEVMQTNQFADRLREEAQKENDEFFRNVDENIRKIIKEQVKERVKAQVSKIFPRIEQAVNEQLEAEVLTRSSHSSRTSYAVVADLSEMELKKILIEKIKGNKSIQRSDAQRNLYNALVDAYESDKIILGTYGETVTLKRRRDDDEDKDEEPSNGPDRGSKRRREGKEPESASTPLKTATKSAGSQRNHHLRIVIGIRPYQLSTPLPLIPNNQGRRVIPFAYFINNDLEYLRGGVSSRKYTTSVTKTKAVDYGHIKWIEDLVPRTMWIQEPIDYDKHAFWGVSHWGRKRQQFYGFVVNRESARDVYSKRRIIAVTELKIVEWHSYKHLDWITVRRNFKRLRIQDIEDMLLLLVQGKLTNLTVEEHFAFNVSLQMFTRSIVIQRRVEDLQLSVESYQKKLNLTKLDTYRSDLKRKGAYTAYSNPRGFIYQNKDKQNRLMWIDELYKFSDGTLTDVRTALDDRLKGIRIQYLPQTIWR
uniref:Uncharacterized protein n=1 Tax=Tanacetum cinerariifolium TaxID=118510 RepID=A0A6L2M4J6_TANCI|nr:hypothetical protein [Tanacetum cinerariifolium]